MRLYPLEFIRARIDLIQTHNVLKELKRVDGEMLSLVGELHARGHCYKIRGHVLKLKDFF